MCRPIHGPSLTEERPGLNWQLTCLPLPWLVLPVQPSSSHQSTRVLPTRRCRLKSGWPAALLLLTGSQVGTAATPEDPVSQADTAQDTQPQERAASGDTAQTEQTDSDRAKVKPDASAAQEVAQAKERQAEAARNGDTDRARRLEALASQWERVRKARIQAAKLETAATRLEKKNLELEAQAARAITLVEQTEARRARALARLRKLGLDARDAGIVASDTIAPLDKENQKRGSQQQETKSPKEEKTDSQRQTSSEGGEQ